MIEFIAEDICKGCNRCVEVCPNDVLDAAPVTAGGALEASGGIAFGGGGTPTIARVDDCDSCRQCALHCPESAIYVSLLNKPSVGLDRQAVIAAGKLGSYAKWLGWEKGQPPGGEFNPYTEPLRELRGGGVPPDPADKIRWRLYDAKDRNYI